MSDLGTRIHALVEWTAPPLDGYEITRGPAPRRARWVPILAAFVIVIVVGAFSFVFGSWEPGTPVADEGLTPVAVTDPVVEEPVVGSTTATTFGQPELYSLRVVRVDCTEQLEAFPCAALIDNDPATEWQTRAVVQASFRFYFAEPTSVGRIGFTNILDETRFLRNGRVRMVEIGFSDGRSDVVELDDSNAGTQWVDLAAGGLTTEWVDMRITAAYPGVSVGDLEPFMETALAGVVFEGYELGNDFLGLVYGALEWVRPDSDLIVSLGLEQCGNGPIDARAIGVARTYCRANREHYGGFTMRTYVTNGYAAPLPGESTVDVSDPPPDWPTHLLSDGSVAYIDESVSEWGEIEGLGQVPLTDPNVSWHVIVVKREGLIIHLNAQKVGSAPPPTGISGLETLLAIADSISIELPLPSP